MTNQLKPETAARIANLATRLGFTGADADERVLQMALDGLEYQALPPDHELTPDQIGAEKEYWMAVGKRNRALYPFDDDNPPSKAWQEELYDHRGLPK